jgi:hypothetical protein
MDLSTPPVTGPQMSPRRQYVLTPTAPSDMHYHPQAHQPGYSPPASLDFQYQLQAPFSSDNTSVMYNEFPPTSWKQQHSEADESLWKSSVRSSSESSTVPSVPSTVASSFAHYDSCLSTQFTHGEDFVPPHSGSIALSRTPSSSASANDPVSISPRGSIVYDMDHAHFENRMNGASSHHTAFETSPATVDCHLPYPGSRVLYSSSPQPFYLDDSEAPWAGPRQIPPAYGEATTSVPGLPYSPRQHEGASRQRRPSRRRGTPKEEANYQCKVKGCGKFFSRNYNYKSHMETHDESREYPFPCAEEGCTKRFVRKTDLQRHHQSVHAKVRNHKCDYCDSAFARKDTLRRHMEDGCRNRFDIGTLDVASGESRDANTSDQALQAYIRICPADQAAAVDGRVQSVPHNAGVFR